MSERKYPEGKKPDDLPTDASPGDNRSGRVAFDARGNPIWEWQLETGVYSRDVNTQKLKKLDLGELSLVETGTHKKLDETEAPKARRVMPGGGFNPYDTAPQPEDTASPYDRARAAAAKKNQPPEPPPPPAATPRTPADLRKLDEWIKMKRQIGSSRDGKK